MLGFGDAIPPIDIRSGSTFGSRTFTAPDARYRHHVEEGDKPYFFGWKDNTLTPPDRVGAANLDKTQRCFGQRICDICERTNQSSRWTADPDRARDYFEPRR